MRKITILLSLGFVLLLLGRALAVNPIELTTSVESVNFAPAAARSNPSPIVAQFAYDLAVTNIGMDQKTGSDWNDCPEYSEYWRFWIKIHNAGYEVVDCAEIVFTVNGQEIGREHVSGLYPSDVIKLTSPEFHIEWDECTPFIIDAHVDWPLDENPENDSLSHTKYVSGHVDECLRYDDGTITGGWTWLPDYEYPDWAMASKWHFDHPWTVVYVELWFSQTTAYPRGHVEFFAWAEDPNNPGYPLDNTPDDIIYRNEYQLHPDHHWPDYQYVCFPVCIDVMPGETYFFGYCNRQQTIQFLCIDGFEDYPDRNMHKFAGVWYTGLQFGGDWFIHPCVQLAGVLMVCENLTPIFCRGKNFYFKLSVENRTEDDLSGPMTFSGYAGYDCDPGNNLVNIVRNKTYPPGITENYYFFQAPNAALPSQYSASVSGTLAGCDLFCCMNTDIIQCSPFKVGDNTEWQLMEVERPEVELPTFTSLDQNYPNPFNANTSISYTLTEAGNVSLKVYDISGRLVTTLVDQRQEAGEHEVTWDGSDVSSGVYFYKLQTSVFTDVKEMNLLK